VPLLDMSGHQVEFHPSIAMVERPTGSGGPASPSPSSFEKTNESLPEAFLAEFDAVRIQGIVDDVMNHYKVPVAFLAMEGPNDLKLKARRGLLKHSVPINSIARHGISRDLPIIIEDIGQTPRFENDPLVVGPPAAGFFAGAPLMMRHRKCVGTLCIMDTAPRKFDLCDSDFLVRSAKAIVCIYKMAAETKDFWTLTVSSLDPMQGKSDPDSEEVSHGAPYHASATLESLGEASVEDA